jgi:hypothetical protein
MNSQELRALQEAYNQVCELDEALDPKFGSMRKRGGRSAPPEERSVGGEMNRRNKDYWADTQGANRDRGAGNKAKRRAAELNKEEVETDLFDYILEHLIAEGYADTNEAALAIMANMSEEWRESIVEAVYGGGKSPTDTPADTRMVVTKADKTANTKAWQEYSKGNPAYKPAAHLKGV